MEDPVGIGPGDFDFSVAVPVEQRSDRVGCVGDEAV
jgi:hypothetical protein